MKYAYKGGKWHVTGIKWYVKCPLCLCGTTVTGPRIQDMYYRESIEYINIFRIIYINIYAMYLRENSWMHKYIQTSL